MAPRRRSQHPSINQYLLLHVGFTALGSELASIRKNGFAENRHESERGVVSVAAPLRDAGHNVVAALSVAGPSDRMDGTRRHIIHHVRRLPPTQTRQPIAWAKW